MIKLKSPEYPWPLDLQRWRSNLWLNNQSFNMNQINTAGRQKNQTTPHKTTNDKPPHLGDEITKKKPRSMWKITYLDWNREKKMKRGDFRSKIDPKPPPQWKSWKKKSRERKLGPAYWRGMMLTQIYTIMPLMLYYS